MGRTTLNSIALLPHSGKEEALALAKRLIPELEARGAAVWVEPDVGPVIGRDDVSGGTAELTSCEVALVLGGDGALLKAARLMAPHEIPILGVNMGHLGFLTEIEPEGVEKAIDRLFRGEYAIEERMMLSAQVVRSGERVASYFGLNDAVVTRGVFARVIEFETNVDGHHVGRFLGDGVILSTPTGSTAYSLSAGGPIVSPNVKALIVTPICPHTVGARTLVTCPDECVSIRLCSKVDDAMLTVDGQVGEALHPGDEVHVRRAGKPARLVRMNGRPFFTLLHDRFLRESARAVAMRES